MSRPESGIPAVLTVRSNYKTDVLIGLALWTPCRESRAYSPSVTRGRTKPVIGIAIARLPCVTISISLRFTPLDVHQPSRCIVVMGCHGINAAKPESKHFTEPVRVGTQRFTKSDTVDNFAADVLLEARSTAVQSYLINPRKQASTSDVPGSCYRRPLSASRNTHGGVQ